MIPLGILSASKPNFVGLLDLYPGASSAYSFRKLRSAYTGNCIRAYKGGVFLDIGFVNNYIDISTLMTFAGSGNVEIITWYDQSGNGNDAISVPGNLPSIVVSGVLQTKNSLVTSFHSIDKWYRSYKFAAPSTNWTYLCVANINSTTANTIIGSDGDGFNFSGIYNTNTAIVVNGSGSTASVSAGTSTTNLNTTSSVYYSNNTSIFSQNNVSSSLTNMLISGNPYTNKTVQTDYFLGRYAATLNTLNTFVGNISEFITYQNSTINANAIRSEQITYYSIT